MSSIVRSLTEIAAIERAYELDAPTLGHAAAALLARWETPLRDEETFMRLAFLSWYRENEPDWLTGLDKPLPTIAQLIAGRGGEAGLSPEALFTLGLLFEFQPQSGSDEAAARHMARSWIEDAARMEPESRLFRDWRYLLGEAKDTIGARVHIEAEIHARYAGRGALGEYMDHMLRARLRPDKHPQSAI